MHASPRVTVAIPTWNRADLLLETVQSVLAQSVEDIEVFVSDNASTDHTSAAIATIDDPRLHYLRHERNVGMAANETGCLRLGTAPYIALLHDDDLLPPASLEHRLAVMELHPSVGLVHSAFSIIGEHGETLRPHTTWADAPTDPIEDGHLFIERTMSRGCRVGLVTVMLRRAAVADLSFEERFGTACDHILWLKVALRWKVAYLATAEAAIRMHATSQSALGASDYEDGGIYHETFDQIALLRNMTLQFLDETEGIDRRHLRRAALRRSQQVLADEVRRLTLPDRRPVTTWRLLRDAARVEPTLYRGSATRRLLISSLAAEPGRRLVRRARRSITADA